MTQEEIEAKVKLAEEQHKFLYPFEIVKNKETNEVETVVLFEEELEQQHKDGILGQFVNTYNSLPKEVQDKFVQILLNTMSKIVKDNKEKKLTDSLEIVKGV